MTHYRPDPATGIRGDTPLSEHVEAQGFAPSELRGPGVYTLRCCRPDDPGAAWDREFDARPEYLANIVLAERVAYVGAAADVYARLADHVAGDVRKARLLEVCPPHSLFDVVPFDTAERAFTREKGIAMDLQHEHETWYVHSR